MSKLDQVIRYYGSDVAVNYHKIVSELRSINEYVQSIYHAALDDEKDENVTGDVWERVFDAVFNDHVSKRAIALSKEIGSGFDWYDPDTTYEEDATAFITAFNSYVEAL